VIALPGASGVDRGHVTDEGLGGREWSGCRVVEVLWRRAADGLSTGGSRDTSLPPAGIGPLLKE
jgi:hypothetical protein